MKHLNLKVSIEDNELFGEEVTKALKAQAKKIARESINEEMVKEIDRISKDNLDKLGQHHWHSPIRNMVAESVRKSCVAEFNIQNEDFKKIIEDKIVAALGRKIDDHIETTLKLLINKSLANAIQSYLEES